MIKQIEINTTCCDKEMHYNNCQQDMLHPSADRQSWVCQECGRYITVMHDQMDIEEIDNLIENEEWKR